MTPLVALRRFEMGARTYHPGDSVDASDSTAQRLVAQGLARAADADAADPIPLADAVAALRGRAPVKQGVSRKARSVCSTPGCPELVAEGKCDRCTSAANAARRPAKRPYGTRAWRRTRAAFLAAHPLCMCAAHAALPAIARPPATEVDHVDGLGPMGPRGHDWSNLLSLTKSCHSRKTANETFR